MSENGTEKRLDDFREDVSQRFNAVDRCFDAVDKRFDRVEGEIKVLRAESNAFRAETKRGFELVGASLADYNRTLLQVGGGIIAALIGLAGTVVVVAIT